MKFNLTHYVKRSFLFASLCLSGLMAHAQDLKITEIRPDSLSVCLDDYQFAIQVINTTGLPATNISILVNLPQGINYSGNLINASELNVSNTNDPVFGINSLPANDTIMVYYTVRSNCSIIQDLNAGAVFVSNSIQVNYSLNGLPKPTYNVPTQSYNLLYAKLSISLTGQNLSLVIGNTVDETTVQKRIIRVINSGFGAIDTVYIRITPESEITYTGFVARDLVTPIPYTFSGGQYVLMLSGSLLNAASNNLGGYANLLDQNEEILIYERFKVSSCTGGNSEYQVEWGCNTVVCNTTSEHVNANVNVSNGNPLFDFSIGSKVDVAGFCGEDGTMKFKLVNTGQTAADFAKNIQIDLLSYTRLPNGQNLLPTAFTLYDYRINGVPVDASLITAVPILALYAPATGSFPAYKMTFTGNTNSALLDDLDLDGFYDDLGAGDSIVLTVKIHFNHDPRLDNECNLNYRATFGQVQMKWDTPCGNETRKSIGGSNWGNLGYAVLNQLVGQGLADPITEPLDFVEGTSEKFTFCTGTWTSNMDFFKCPVDSFYGIINLPNGYHLAGTSAEWFSERGDSIIYPAAEVGNQVFIYGGGESNLPNSNNKWSGCFDVYLSLICPISGTVSSTSVISWEFDYKCDTCSVIQRRACASETVNNHFNSCGTGDCNGILSTDFHVERTTLGWTDHTRTTHVTRNTPGINLNAVYPYDSILSTTSGRVLDTDFEAVFTEVKYSSTDTLFTWSYGNYQIYRNGVLVSSIAASAPILTVQSGVYKMTFQFPSGQTLAVGDSIVLSNKWLIQNSTIFSNNRYDLPSFRSTYLVSKNNVRSSCSSWGQRLIFYSVNTFPMPRMNIVPNACNDLPILLNWINFGGSELNDFPYEFRNIGKLDRQLKFILPQGYEFVPNSARMFAFKTNDLNALPRFTTVSTIPITPAIVGDTLYFNEDWPLLDKSGQSISGGFSSPQTMSFNIRPYCEHKDSVFALFDFNYTKYDYLEETDFHQRINWVNTFHQDLNNPATNMFWVHTKPNLTTTTGLTTVDAYSKDVSWDVTVCNKIDTKHPTISRADGVWLDFDNLASNQGQIKIDQITEVGSLTPVNYTYYNSDNSVFAQIGLINTNTCRTFRIKASYTNCVENEIDSIRVLTAWNCGGYPQPADADNSVCQVNTNILRVRYHSADLQWLVSDPKQTQEICMPFTYEIELNSSGTASMYDLDVWTNLPNGVSIAGASYLYPLTGTWVNLPAPSTAYTGTNAYGWKLSALISALNNGLVGNIDPTKNRIRIRFNLQASCNYDPSDELLIFADGTTNCNDSKLLSARYFLPVTGFESLVNYNLQFTNQDSLNCRGDKQIQLTISNTSNYSNPSSDSLRIAIPTGFSYVAGSASPAQALVSNNFLYWNVANIVAQSSITYSFQIEPLSNFTGCEPVSLFAEVFKNSISTCQGICAIKASWIEKDSSVYCCSPCSADASFAAANPCLGAILTATATQNEGTHLWIYSDQNQISMDATPTFTATHAGNYSLTHIITSTCGTADTVVRAITVSSVNCAILGSGPTCNNLTQIYSAPSSVQNLTYNWSLTNVLNATLVGSGSSVSVVSGNCEAAYTLNLNVQDPITGCEADCSMHFAYQDLTPPTLTKTGIDMTLGDCTLTPVFTTPTASDNCDANPLISVVSDQLVENLDGSKTYIRVWQATDICGNVSNLVEHRITVPSCCKSETLSDGSCKKCDASMTVHFDPLNPACVSITSCKDLSNVVLMDCIGTKYKFDNLSGKTAYFCHPSALAITTVWVKSGCFQSGDGPGYGRRFDHPCAPCSPNKALNGSTMPESASKMQFEVFPNPFAGTFTLNYQTEETANVEVLVSDMFGKLVYQAKLNPKMNQHEVDLSLMADGMYLIQIINENRIVDTQRMIKIK